MTYEWVRMAHAFPRHQEGGGGGSTKPEGGGNNTPIDGSSSSLIASVKICCDSAMEAYVIYS